MKGAARTTRSVRTDSYAHDRNILSWKTSRQRPNLCTSSEPSTGYIYFADALGIRESGSDCSIKSCANPTILYGEKQFVRCDAKCVRQTTESPNRRVPRAALQVADIAALHARLQRKLLLGHSLQLTMAADVCAEEQNHVHAAICPQGMDKVCIPIVSFLLVSWRRSDNCIGAIVISRHRGKPND